MRRRIQLLIVLLLVTGFTALKAQVEANTTYLKFKISKSKGEYVYKRYKKLKSSIQLHLKDDSTYSYQKILPSYKPKIVNAEGKYKVKGNRIVLYDFVVKEKGYLRGAENVYGIKKLYIVDGFLLERKHIRFINRGGFVIPSAKNVELAE